jgi:rhomboid protease GluP
LVLGEHEYWRVLAALFLHANWAHLLFNLFALYVLGPPFEQTIGSLRFLICYLGSGICSTVGVVAFSYYRGDNDFVLGASGCIMGIVGAWAAFLIRDRHDPLVRRRLANIVFIVVVQTIFDRLTPQISMTAHMCGLIGGFLIGLLITAIPAPRRSAGRSGRSWAGHSRAG